MRDGVDVLGMDREEYMVIDDEAMSWCKRIGGQQFLGSSMLP